MFLSECRGRSAECYCCVSVEAGVQNVVVVSVEAGVQNVFVV